VYTGTDQIKVNSVVTSLPTAVTNNSARCNGIGLISDHSSSNAWFEYGETANLGRTTATAFIGSAATSPFSNVLAGLKPSTTYYCRAVMTNAHGTVKGDIVRFTTKTNKVVYVKQTMTPVKKTITTTKQIICSDGSTVTVNNPTTAGLIADGSKLVAIQLEKVDGDLSGGSMASYRLSYKNVTNVPLSNVIFKVTIPEEFALLSATAGAYDKDTHTITVPVLSLDAGTQGSITWKVKVANDAPIGKAVVTTGYVDYTVPGTDGVTPVQDEVTAYVIGSIMPGGDAASATSSDMQSNRTFLPDTLIEWFALFAIILILMILGRSVYLSWKGEKEAH
jgi:hypothetical protein